MTEQSHGPHSFQFLNETRNDWWNTDFLQLIATRTGLSRCRDVLDVGCGLGHFGRLLAPLLAPGFSLVGVDPELAWVAGAQQRAAHFVPHFAGSTMTFRQGRVEQLPFEDHTFDAVFCQTVLIHVSDPTLAFAEMKRVTKPGGLLLVAEPNNYGMFQRFATELAHNEDPELVGKMLTNWLRMVRGKRLLGQGDLGFGVQLPKLFASLCEPQYFTNDRPFLLSAPYDTPPQQRALSAEREAIAKGLWSWPRTQAQEFWLAGGGQRSEFDAAYDGLLAFERKFLSAVDAGTHFELSAIVLFVASGRMPRLQSDQVPPRTLP
jgi:ubiquinone/menaquinone biosynthesis C-methylase UbiE